MHLYEKSWEALQTGLFNNIYDYVPFHAKRKPKELALIEADTGEEINWKNFKQNVDAFAAQLLEKGIHKGDVVATSLPLLKEHVYIIYACFKIGAIIAPLDLRLKPIEIIECFHQIKPKAYFFLGKTELYDFRPIILEVMKKAPYPKLWVQMQKEKHRIIPNAHSILDFVKGIKGNYIKDKIFRKSCEAKARVTKRSPCLIIFTTGSTGAPKPALICHENILIQNIGLAKSFRLTPKDRMLVNLPPSHVGCMTEQLLTVVYGGSTAVLMHIFKPKESLQYIEKYKVSVIGQIPALFQLQWNLPEYHSFDLSSLRLVLYGGQAVSQSFLEKMKNMAPEIATGLGLTETAGFVTYTRPEASVEEIAAGIGYATPLCPISIRSPMKETGEAGDEVTQGEIGEVCFSGPQVFLGYMGNDKASRQTVSKDGICYTGDLGFYDDKGLHFSGRKKMVIKPKGHQVFPDEVENFIANSFKSSIDRVACVGVAHEIYSEAIVALIETKLNEHISTEDILSSCQNMAAFKRPSHIVLLENGKMPLNRVLKVDYLEAKKLAQVEIEKLRKLGKWDQV